MEAPERRRGHQTGGLGRAPRRAAAELTERERDSAAPPGRGWDNQRIGAELHISERTVRFHLRNIYDKIGAHTRAEAVVWAVNHKL
ncbi:MAG: response regulator transcription factor [Dehalococcoidia bacterium]|nr:response regulator transcription factor [Dehalococcoidia bacterium]